MISSFNILKKIYFREEELIRSAIRNNEFLSQVLYDQRTLNTFINCMHKENTKTNQILIEKGQKGTHLFISITGAYKVILDKETSFIFDDVRVFGELAVLYSATRLATVEAIDAGSIWVLDCPTYKRLTVKSAIKQQDETISFLLNIPTLNRISKEKLYQVANLLKSEFFKPSEVIIRQCEIGEKFYIIRAGKWIILPKINVHRPNDDYCITLNGIKNMKNFHIK